MTTAGELLSRLPGLLTIAQVREMPDSANVFTITSIATKTLPNPNSGKDEDKEVMFFTESKKGLIINSQRGQCLAHLFGQEPLEGKQVRLVVDTFKGKEQVTFSAV